MQNHFGPQDQQEVAKHKQCRRDAKGAWVVISWGRRDRSSLLLFHKKAFWCCVYRKRITQLAIYMWPIWAVQPGSIWVPFGLAHVNKIKYIVDAGADPGFLARGSNLHRGSIWELYLIIWYFMLIFLEISHGNGIILSQKRVQANHMNPIRIRRCRS